MKNTLRILRPVIPGVLVLALSFGGCATPTNGPVSAGAIHGSLPTTDMKDYFYPLVAGYTLTYSNVQKIYDGSGNLVQTLTAPDDDITTLGPTGQNAPNGDPMYQISIHYRVLSSYASGDEIDDNFFSSVGSTGHGAFVPIGSSVTGMTAALKRPRPVSTDTILAGKAGRLRTGTNDFTNNGTYSWKTDVITFSANGDAVSIWEQDANGNWFKSRSVFVGDFVNGLAWGYDVENNPTTGRFKVGTDDCSVTTDAGTFGHCVKISMIDKQTDPYSCGTADRWYAYGNGKVKEVDAFWITSDGSTCHKEEFIQELKSITNPQ